MNKNQGTHPTSKYEEVDLVAFSQIVWKKRLLVLKIFGVFLTIGLIVAILSPKEFTASSTFLPQTEASGKGGNLGGLASLAGISLGGLGSGSEIPPSLYPQIVNSVKFKRSLLTTPLTIESKNIETTYAEYYQKHYSPGFLNSLYRYTLGLPGLIFSSTPPEEENFTASSYDHQSSLIRLTPQEIIHFSRLKSQIEVIHNDQEGTVQLSFIMPDPLMAAQMAKAAEEMLQNEVISFKIQNAKEQLNFTEEQFREKKRIFQQKQKELAKFRDRNQHISSAMAMNQLQSLEAEYNFAFNIYTEMAKQLEQTKLQVSKDTPVFSIINPVNVPIEKSAPKKSLILILFTILGLITALVVIIAQQFLGKVKNRWNNKIS